MSCANFNRRKESLLTVDSNYWSISVAINKNAPISEAILEAYWDHLRNLEIFEYTWDLHFPNDVLAFNVKCDIQLRIPFRRRYVHLYNKSIIAPVLALGATGREYFPHVFLSPAIILDEEKFRFMTLTPPFANQINLAVTHSI